MPESSTWMQTTFRIFGKLSAMKVTYFCAHCSNLEHIRFCSGLLFGNFGNSAVTKLYSSCRTPKQECPDQIVIRSSSILCKKSPKSMPHYFEKFVTERSAHSTLERIPFWSGLPNNVPSPSGSLYCPHQPNKQALSTSVFLTLSLD